MAVERYAAQRGETVRLRMRFEQSGTLADPSSIDSIQILDEAYALVATLAVGDVVHDGVGLYHIDWPVPAAEPMEWHHDRWTVTPVLGASQKTFTLGFYVHDFTGAAAGASYMTIDELKAYLPTATELTNAQIAAMGDLAQEIVETICQQRFLPFAEARVFSGLGKAVQPLDLPIVPGTVTKIEVLYSDTGWTDVTPTNSDDIRYMRGRKMIGLGNVWSRSQRYWINQGNTPYWLRSTDACGVFPVGLQNVRITATWGRYTEVPLQIKAAIGLLVREAGSCNDPAGVPANPYVNESVEGGRSYTLRQILTVNSRTGRSSAQVDRLTGYPEVDSILKRFSRQPAIVTVI